MTTSTLAPPVTPPEQARPASVLRVYRFELRKLLAQWRIRVLLVACWLGPGVLVAVVSQQSTLPVDTVFGRWMGATGWAGALVVLSFCCSWVLPLLVSLVAGDAFAVEDRLGTWRHLLVTTRSTTRLFAAKVLASLTMVLLLASGLLLSSVAGGLAVVGDRALVGLDGHVLTPGQAGLAVLLAWASAGGPTLAFAGLGLLGSVSLGRSPTGLLLPALFALLLQLAQLLALPTVVRASLPSYGFVAWHGLFTDPVQTTPVVVGLVVSLLWAVLAISLAYALFQHRDFTDSAGDGLGRRALATAVLPLGGLLAGTVAVVAAVTPVSGSGIDQAGLQTSL
ncbi:MAG: hypothetical protein JWL64_1276, partial [Frankiales bacterium]|nr:hypothetical protein [Frankiales bacterium]